MGTTKKNKEVDGENVRKTYGYHPFWEVFRHNFLKLIAVDILSKSFITLAGSCILTASFLSHQLTVEKQNLEWLELLVAIVPPTFFAVYWIEKRRAGNILSAIAEWIRNKK